MKFLAMHITNLYYYILLILLMHITNFDIFTVENVQNIFMEHDLYLMS